MATQILIADDDPTIRLLLRRLVEKQRDWQVCGEASNGVEAIEGVEQFKPDVVVMDLAMPVMNGLQAGPEIAKAHPRLPMLLISVQEVSKQLAWEARSAGYRGAVTRAVATKFWRESRLTSPRYGLLWRRRIFRPSFGLELCSLASS